MKTYRIPHTDLDVSRVAYGCMRIGGTWDHTTVSAEIGQTARATVHAALDWGINFFRHAHIVRRVEAVLLAWIPFHPAGMRPIIGTTRAERVRASAFADDVTLSREHWYALLNAARGKSVP